MPAKKRTQRTMTCYTCNKTTVLEVNDLKNEQYDAFATKHKHNPDWLRWTNERNKDPDYPSI